MSNKAFEIRLQCYPNFRQLGDKINLPEEYLQRLMNDYSPPFYFEICKRNARIRIERAKKAKAEEEKKKKVKTEEEHHKMDDIERITVCGVFEFTAPKGRAIVPKWLMTELKIPRGGYCELKLLPGVVKGRLIQLQPFKTVFSTMLESVGSLRPIEDALVNFTALKKDTVIQIRYEEKDYKLHVIDTQPNDIVSVNHTGELKLDLHLAKDAKSTKLMKQRFGAAIESIWSSDSDESDVDPEEKQDNRSRPGAKVGGGEEAVWGREESAQTEEAALREIYAFNEDKAPPNFNRQGSLLLSEVDSKRGMERCGVCHHQFTKAQLISHYPHCKLIHMRCPLPECNALINKDELKYHQENEHSMVTCECGMDVMKSALRKHHERFCVSRIRCKYCLEMFPFAEYHGHVGSCGERMLACPKCSVPTKIRSLLDGSHKRQCLMPCPDCGQRVRACDLANHLANACRSRMVRCTTCSGMFTPAALRNHTIGCEARNAEMMQKLGGGGWRCHACNFQEMNSKTACSVCGTAKRGGGNVAQPAARPMRWNCGTCTFNNAASATKCGVCDRNRP